VTQILLVLYFLGSVAIAIPLLSSLGHAGNLAGTTSGKILAAALIAMGTTRSHGGTITPQIGPLLELETADDFGLRTIRSADLQRNRPALVPDEPLVAAVLALVRQRPSSNCTNAVA